MFDVLTALEISLSCSGDEYQLVTSRVQLIFLLPYLSEFDFYWPNTHVGHPPIHLDAVGD